MTDVIAGYNRWFNPHRCPLPQDLAAEIIAPGELPIGSPAPVDPDSSWDILAWPQTAAPPQPPQGLPLWWAKVDRLSTSTTLRRSTPPTLVWLAIGTLRHHLLPMVRVDAPAPAKIGVSTRFNGVNYQRSRIGPVAGTTQSTAST
jgi:hypothetical protein